MTIWMVRAGRRGEQEDLALEQGIACIGWDDVPDLGPYKTVEAVVGELRKIHPEDSEPRAMTHARQLHAFAHRIAKGDLIVLPLKTRSQIAIGEATGSYRYRKDLGSGAMHTRGVKWIRTDLPRTTIGQDLLFSLGAFLTVCQIHRNDAESRFAAILAGKPDPGFSADEEEEEEDEAAVARDIEQDAEDQILKHIIARFKGHEMARLVEAVLQAEGYVTKRSPAGPDGGVDILAGRGPLGLEGPRLCVQVKSSESPADVTILRALQGTMSTFKADQGLLVSWGGVNGPAEKESRHSFFSVRIWDSKDLLRAVFRNYANLPEDIQAELPLKRVWALVPEVAV